MYPTMMEDTHGGKQIVFLVFRDMMSIFAAPFHDYQISHHGSTTTCNLTVKKQSYNFFLNKNINPVT